VAAVSAGEQPARAAHWRPLRLGAAARQRLEHPLGHERAGLRRQLHRPQHLERQGQGAGPARRGAERRGHHLDGRKSRPPKASSWRRLAPSRPSSPAPSTRASSRR
jgi:hypothetical protein